MTGVPGRLRPCGDAHEFWRLLLVAVVALSSCQDTGERRTSGSAPPEPPATARGIAFEVSGDDPSAPVYLIGSIHLMRKSDHPLPASYLRAYAAAEQVVFEVPPGERSGAEARRVIDEHIHYADGTTIREHLSPAAYRRLTRQMKR